MESVRGDDACWGGSNNGDRGWSAGTGEAVAAVTLTDSGGLGGGGGGRGIWLMLEPRVDDETNTRLPATAGYRNSIVGARGGVCIMSRG